MKNKFLENQQGGFLRLIIFIVVGIFLLSYFNIKISDIWNWFIGLLHNVL